jgi:transcriptional regulator with GAF, ATPase, and Fis domain
MGVARVIHENSARGKKPLMIVDCTALSPTLIESVLFGHEKGSFTGAVDKRTGKFEQAVGGTIFLDEVGGMPIEIQFKLLRVLQEKEICPIGGLRKKVNVRIIVANNRNLEEEVSAGRFV